VQDEVKLKKQMVQDTIQLLKEKEKNKTSVVFASKVKRFENRSGSPEFH